MNNLSTYILEKLKISKTINEIKPEYLGSNKFKMSFGTIIRWWIGLPEEYTDEDELDMFNRMEDYDFFSTINVHPDIFNDDLEKFKKFYFDHKYDEIIIVEEEAEMSTVDWTFTIDKITMTINAEYSLTDSDCGMFR